MAATSMNGPWTLRIPAPMMRVLHGHLFPGDHDEHGAVIGAAVVQTSRGTRLLARRLFLAMDGVDYVPGQRGYRMLTASFVRGCALKCADEGLAYLAIHCHGGERTVSFSSDDLESHERGYPALLDILAGPPVGGLVFARSSVAGDIWIGNGRRLGLERTDVVSRVPERLFPHPPAVLTGIAEEWDRQVRLFGDAGQALLSQLKVGIVGVGGAGSLVNEYVARLGVGHIVVVDPERLDPTNLPRVVGALLKDVRSWLTHRWMPEFIRSIGLRRRSSKVSIARRVALASNPEVVFEGIQGDVSDAAVLASLVDCDFVFLAADTMQARLVANALVHQYLIPGVQVGAKVDVDRETGQVRDAFSVVRHMVPGESCLWCNQLIDPARLAEEATNPEQLRRQRYIEEIPAPSVITLNAVSAAHAVNDFLFAVTGLATDVELRWRKVHPLTDTVVSEVPRRDDGCSECVGRLGAGSSLRMPVRGS